MSTFVVQGGLPLKGAYKISGAKNAAPKLLIASLLSDKTCAFQNIPRFSDTFRSIDAITAVGGSTRFTGYNSVEITCERICSIEIPQEAQTARQSVLFIGAMLARAGKVKLYPPKGDEIGKRPLNRHLEGMKALGANIRDHGNYIIIEMPQRPQATTYRFEKNTHCGTENLILASVFNTGTVRLENCAEEPEVDNLIDCLNQMGANIVRTDPRTIKIEGVTPLLQGAVASSIPDRLEMATAITLAAMNKDGIEIQNARPELIKPFIQKLEEIGVQLTWNKDSVSVSSLDLPLQPTTITTDWEPGFITDWQPLITLLLAYLSKGKSMIHERIFETRWRYLNELSKMGVQFETFQPQGFGAKDYNFNDEDYSANDPHAAYVWGPTELKSAELNAHDVRAGIDMLLGSLFAKGTSTVRDPQNHIDRGYENIVEKLTNLGASIQRT